MAEVVAPDHATRHPGSIGSMPLPAVPVIDMVSTPGFSFPVRPQLSQPPLSDDSNDSRRRPATASMHIDIPRSDLTNVHRRTASTLPSFSFNSRDNTGREDVESPPRTPEESVATTPVRKGHRRGGSEFVGGFGVSNAVSSSPTKGAAQPEVVNTVIVPPSGRRGHNHRRSAAISNHDVGKVMQAPADVQPRRSDSMPSTPLDKPIDSIRAGSSVESLELDLDPARKSAQGVASTRPESRPRVGFSDNVEFIPRPLSTISSETESSISTMRGHSVNNSISSVLSLGSPSPLTIRSPKLGWSPRRDGEAIQRIPSSTQTGRRIEKEGHWLRRTSSENLERPVSESAVTHPRTTFIEPTAEARPHRRATSYALGLDRRRSEPLMGLKANEPSRLSAISLQETASGVYNYVQARDNRVSESKSSARKIVDWAASKITKRTKEASKGAHAEFGISTTPPVSSGSVSVPVNGPVEDSPVAETDLDAVFSSGDAAFHSQSPATPVQSRVEFNCPAINQRSNLRYRGSDEPDVVLDLDAALGPFKTPPLGSQRPRKELHSSRLTKDFVGLGGHYHRRAESEPVLPPFEEARMRQSGLPNMADVFEEDEEIVINRTNPLGLSNTSVEATACTRVSGLDTESQTRDASTTAHQISDNRFDLREGWELERPPSSHSNNRSMLSHITFEGRGTSIVEETIMEEESPVGDVEIVEAHEEPRTSSQTKSSDSSDAPTILPIHNPTLALSEGQRSLATPETYQTSAFPSPALRPGSFDRLDTAASSITDNRTLSSVVTGDHSHELRISTDVPSLTSSRSTMISSVLGNNSRRDFSHPDRTLQPVNSSRLIDLNFPDDRQRKRSSIQSLSQLVGNSFGTKSKDQSNTRPQSSVGTNAANTLKKEPRLKKLMFWKSRQRSKKG